MRTIPLIAVMVAWCVPTAAAADRELSSGAVDVTARTFDARAGDMRQFTWWLPLGAAEYVLPISGGVSVLAADAEAMRWVRQGSPWELTTLPAFGARYGERTLVVIVPWPHYAELIVADRVGIRFAFPEGRNNTTPCGIVAQWAGPEPLAVARVFRDWRRTAAEVGGVPRPRPLTDKAKALPSVERLFGAAHYYLWGPGLFSRHDVDRGQWIPLARALRAAPAGSTGEKLRTLFTEQEGRDLNALAEAEWPERHLTTAVAGAIDRALASRDLLGLSADVELSEVIRSNRVAVAEMLAGKAHDPRSWGDGLSLTLLEAMHDAGLERAVLLLSDLYGRTARPDVSARASELGYLLGPYDSYHSVHAPSAGPDETWETAQFDQAAFDAGRVMNADGRGHAGFQGRGYHFSPQAAWPYVEQRVDPLLRNNGYSAWFIDCDATAECFDDYHPGHPATRVQDIGTRRARLRWFERERGLLVGSEGGSVLFADVIHFGHGVHTPYIGHLDAAFRDRQSPSYLGRHWPPDTPEHEFKAVPLPAGLKSPYFDPRVRIPLYQAAMGDEVIATHHWSFDSLKFSDVEAVRSLMEILYMVPPMYHLNRESWPLREERIRRQVGFWGPLHRQLAASPMIRFEWLTKDRMVQRTTFEVAAGEVTITVNFADQARAGQPAMSARVAGPIDLRHRDYRITGAIKSG